MLGRYATAADALCSAWPLPVFRQEGGKMLLTKLTRGSWMRSFRHGGRSADRPAGFLPRYRYCMRVARAELIVAEALPLKPRITLMATKFTAAGRGAGTLPRGLIRLNGLILEGCRRPSSEDTTYTERWKRGKASSQGIPCCVPGWVFLQDAPDVDHSRSLVELDAASFALSRSAAKMG